MGQNVRLTEEDLLSFEIDREKGIELVKYYSSQYISKEHYEQLGASCIVSVNHTINTIIGSAEYLDGAFLMPDTLNVELIAYWIVKNRDYECDINILTFYIAHYIKRKINELYRCINKGVTPYITLTLQGKPKAWKEYEKQLAFRKHVGVKLIRK